MGHGGTAHPASGHGGMGTWRIPLRGMGAWGIPPHTCADATARRHPAVQWRYPTKGPPMPAPIPLPARQRVYRAPRRRVPVRPGHPHGNRRESTHGRRRAQGRVRAHEAQAVPGHPGRFSGLHGHRRRRRAATPRDRAASPGLGRARLVRGHGLRHVARRPSGRHRQAQRHGARHRAARPPRSSLPSRRARSSSISPGSDRGRTSSTSSQTSPCPRPGTSRPPKTPPAIATPS